MADWPQTHIVAAAGLAVVGRVGCAWLTEDSRGGVLEQSSPLSPRLFHPFHQTPPFARQDNKEI